MIYAIFQIVVITLVVAWSAVQLLRKLMPHTAGKLQRALAAGLQQKQWPQFVQQWGRALQPAASPAAGCDSGCSTCNMCATSVAVDQARPVRIIH